MGPRGYTPWARACSPRAVRGTGSVVHGGSCSSRRSPGLAEGGCWSRAEEGLCIPQRRPFSSGRGGSATGTDRGTATTRSQAHHRGGWPSSRDRVAVPSPPRQPVVVRAGCLPTDHSVWESALLLVDKPQGWSSFQVCNKVRNELVALLRVRRRLGLKVGHAGTLDPEATGLLLVCVGRATRHVEELMRGRKTYEGVMRLGEATPSLDAATPVSETAGWDHVTDADLEAAATAFTGDVRQLPPMFSALKVEGQRLYELARKGETVERTPRVVQSEAVWEGPRRGEGRMCRETLNCSVGWRRSNRVQVGSGESSTVPGSHCASHLRAAASQPSGWAVHELALWREAGEQQNVHLRTVCSKGTYVRTLADDLGRHLRTLAHLTSLRRTSSGDYHVRDAWQMDALVHELKSANLRRVEEGARAC